MLRKTFIAFLFFCSSIFTLQAQEFKAGDLIFQDLQCGPLCDAINAVTKGYQGKDFSHVAIVVNYQYDAAGKAYGLPNHLLFTVDVKKFKIPKALAADVNKTKSASTLPANLSKTGSIDIRLSNIQINKGVEDKVFKK